TRVLTGSDDRVARLWKVASGRLVLVRELPHAGALYWATFSRDGKLLATSTHEDNVVMLWEVTSGRLRAQMRHGAPVRTRACSHDGPRIATASYDRTARLWDTVSGRPTINRPLRHERAVVALAYSPDGNTLLTGAEDRCARRWDAATGALLGQPLRHGS